MDLDRHRGLKRRREAEPAPADDLDKSLLASLIRVCNLPVVGLLLSLALRWMLVAVCSRSFVIGSKVDSEDL